MFYYKHLLIGLSLTYMLCQPTHGTTYLCTICEGLLNHFIKPMDKFTMILVQFKLTARIALPTPPAAMLVVQPSATETSSVPNTHASAEAKADTSSEVKDDPPASVNNA